MNTTIRICEGDAGRIPGVEDGSVDLIVTSPPYPMVEMWDEVFAAQDSRIGGLLAKEKGAEAFERMHALLDGAWAECARVLKPGGIACVNIGDATRTIDGDFRLYSNHSRILQALLDLGLTSLPDILWRKQTNAPNKFMGSGMLPVGAYVTYEHEYILILRKGRRRAFTTADEKRVRRESAFFWEERNVWFSDVWTDLKGARQETGAPDLRKRSAAYPFELSYRLIAMYSVRGDVVLDPFLGSGTTLAAALALGRNGVGVEVDAGMATVAERALATIAPEVNGYTTNRLARHAEWAHEREAGGKPPKYTNRHYGFPVMTAQEQDLLLHEVRGIEAKKKGCFEVRYRAACFSE